MSQQPWSIIPSTLLGRWSVGLIILMPIFFVIGLALAQTFYGSVPSGETILIDLSSRPFLALSMLVGMATGITSFITGLLALIKDSEKAIGVYISAINGGLLLLYLIAEVVFPH